MQFHPKDITQIEAYGLTVDKVKQDLKYFEKGFPTLEVVRPATVGDGILQLSAEEEDNLYRLYSDSDLVPVKFVPASGAASRMFRLLHQFMDEFPKSGESLHSFLEKEDFQSLAPLFESVDQLPFFEDLKLSIEGKGVDLNNLSEGDTALQLTKQMLSKNGFQMADLPKGLIPFHKYDDGKLTAFEEHFYEAAKYIEKDNVAKLHFTISEDHLSKFENKLKDVLPDIENNTGVRFEVEFSFQHPSTDTVCLNAKDELFRDQNDVILFRPAGHGALIQNLNALKEDLVFIKNIDNVAHRDSEDEQRKPTHKYKAILAGLLLQLQEKAFDYLNRLESDDLSDAFLEEVKAFLRNQLNIHVQFKDKQEIIHYLNRPIRVCGMVINEGAPGGGPFWIKNEDDSISLQIVEKSQIDLKQEDQKEKMQASTHFNPVDIVCSLRDYKGKTFDLQDFVDQNKGFIAHKFVGGEPIKALELPGLWNGGMAFWNTVFVEVPVHTFNPVKTVMDLLKPGHQPE
ncbi:DUF4301 family protein [Psychroflexus tropicus]|uniref:DUF4301 family protein n=1 Tax=Psychroflexus tropicus TaxID=197345 RepID=UPI000375F9F3|nr:DUF4301 family protein [Psychroflexus tropicus]